MKQIDFKIITIILLTVILGIICFIYFHDEDQETKYYSNNNFVANEELSEDSSNTTITYNSEVSSLTEDKLELHATYYLEEIYVKINQAVKAGENILKYTNGTYLVAPYDCVITNFTTPSLEGKCTQNHYIEIDSLNNLMVQIKVDETQITNIELGQDATIQIPALENKTIQGNVIDISNTASGGKFNVTIQFDNDGEVMIGMTANVELTINS